MRNALIELIEATNHKNTHPAFKAGDTINVHVQIIEGTKERIQQFKGVCISRKNGTNGGSFNVRKISNGVGVERTFPCNSPNIAKVEVLKVGKVRRAKLFYLRGLSGKAARIQEIIAAKAAK